MAGNGLPSQIEQTEVPFYGVAMPEEWRQRVQESPQLRLRLWLVGLSSHDLIDFNKCRSEQRTVFPDVDPIGIALLFHA